MSAREAQRLADEQELDLVKIAPTATPPVCRIMDYGKYRFEQAKREKEARKNQHVVELKEVRLGLNIDVADFNTKARQASQFLKNGNKVKVSIRFRGREMGHPEIGRDIMNRFAEACAEVAAVERPAKMDAGTCSCSSPPRRRRAKNNPCITSQLVIDQDSKEDIGHA